MKDREEIDRIIRIMRRKPYTLDMGKNKLAKWLGTTPDVIVEAKKYIRSSFGPNRRNKFRNHSFPRILLFDIETSPLEAYIFQKEVWRAKVSNDRTISNYFVLTWSAKWLFDTRIMSATLTGEEALAEDDGRIVKELWVLFDKADVVVSHNISFDVNNMNTRFIVNELPPPSVYQTIDTLKVAQRQFGFTHNSLGALARVLGLSDSKIDVSFDLWKRSRRGDDKALQEMDKYCRRDTLVLEDIYLRIRPWIKSHPNVGLFLESNEPVCASCGSKNVHFDGNYYYTSTGKYPTYVCEDCGGISRSRFSEYDKDKRKNLLVSIAR